jgi:putative FmdB family regulatory protein
MPIYEFECQACKKIFSLAMKVAELEAAKITCPHCGSEDVSQVLSLFSAVTSRKS